MKLSMVDLSPMPRGGSAVDAYAWSVDLAQRAEGLGYERFWVAEHHGNAKSAAGSNPEVLIARVAALTTRIRVGSGTVLLNHYSAFKVAEVFQSLEAMSPGRIDLGIGRANGRPEVDFALQRDRSGRHYHDDYDEQVAEVLSWLDGSFPDGHPFAKIAMHRSDGPQPWILGSSPASGAIAGKLGLRYCFAGFINPGGAVAAAATYREHFRPSPFPTGVSEPYVALGMNVSCGETDAEGDRIRACPELFYQRLRSGVRRGGPLPTPEEAVAELGGVPEPSRVTRGSWPQHISGGPRRVREMLTLMAADLGAKEIVLQDLIGSREDRLRSYELLAEEFDLTSRGPAQVARAGAA
jgi:luciferase family oxidoreductase group 1